MEAGKGMVTSLSSLYPTEDAQKAVKFVEEKIEGKQNEMNRLRQFIADNTNLIGLVQKLPDQLHHDIMVPFGKAAFFPGRLIHTNEFLVLLGESYYAERTSKQTVEILKRRGKDLEFQVDSLNAIMQDLKAEASFFDATASEAAEGLVEIREDYEEENSIERVSESGALKQESSCFSEGDNTKVGVEDEEYARMMSRLDELEKEELVAQSDNERDEHQLTNADESDSKGDEDEQTTANFDQFLDQNSLDHNARILEKPTQQTRDKNTTTEELPNKYQHQQDFTDQLNCTGLTAQPVLKDETSHSKGLPQTVKMSNSAEKAPVVPEGKAKIEAVPSSKNEVTVQKSKAGFDSSKAFTGSIIEHSRNLQTNAQEQTSISSQSSGSQPSKPISRFKMQRR